MKISIAGLFVLVVFFVAGCGGGADDESSITDPGRYQVSTSAGTGGSISPSSRSVAHGETATFEVTSDSGFAIASVTGCDGSSDGGTYTTGAITERCTVMADFIATAVSSFSLSTPPELVSASVVGTSTASLSWLPANIGGSDSIRYTVHLSGERNFVPDSTTATVEVVDQMFAELADLAPERRYYAKVSVPHPDDGMIWSNELSFATGSIPTTLNPDQDFEVFAGASVMSVEGDHIFLADASGLAADSILVSDANGGLFRRVVAVDERTGRVDTTRASLNELFDDLHLSSETRLATLPSITGTEILRLQALSEDVGERREFHWPETGFRLIQETESSPRSRDSETIGGVTPLFIPQSTDSDEQQEQVNDKIRLTAPARVLVEPGSLMQFDVVADLVNDAAMEYEITDLELREIRAPSGMPDADVSTSMVPGVDGTREQTRRLDWTPRTEHFDGQARPYTAEFQATAHQRDCPLWKLVVFCPHSVTVEVPIYVGWSLPEKEEATIEEQRNGGISLSGDMRLNFDPTLRVDKQITRKRLQSAEVIAAGPVTFDFDARIHATSPGKVEGEPQRLFTKRFVKVFAAGPVPVIMAGEFSLTAELEATAFAALDINQKITLGYDLETGLTYERDRDDRWELVREAKPVYRYTLGGEAEAQAELDVRLVPDLQITFYEVATGQMKIEPYLVGAMGLEGQFQYNQELQDGNFNSNGFETAYRFTQLDLSGGLDLKLRADLSVFDFIVAAWPSRDTDEFRIVPVLDETLILGLSDIELEQLAGTRDDFPGAVRIAATVTDRGLLFPFAEGSGRWETSPTPDDLRLLSDPEGDPNIVWICLEDGETSTETEYTVRFLGYSGWAFVQQYEEIKLPLQNCMAGDSGGQDPAPPPEFATIQGDVCTEYGMCGLEFTVAAGVGADEVTVSVIWGDDEALGEMTLQQCVNAGVCTSLGDSTYRVWHRYPVGGFSGELHWETSIGLQGGGAFSVAVDRTQDLALQAQAGDRSVTLDWPALPADEYNLCRSETSVSHLDNCSVEGGRPIDLGIGMPPHLVSGLTNAQPYYFRLEGRFGDKRILSNEATATPTGGGAVSPGTNPLNDTGIDWCADGSNNYDSGDAAYKQQQCDAVANAGYPGQDGHYGRDAAARAGTLTKVGGGNAGFDYTKIANDGSELPASATLGSGPNDWACTRDNVTGLVWEVKVNDPSHLRHQYHTYTWYDPNSPDGNPGTQNGGICSGSDCDTIGFVQAVNSQGLCGASDWRMPAPGELEGIVDYGRFAPAIDLLYFPNTPSWTFWSESPSADLTNNAWHLNFVRGDAFRDDRSINYPVRLVRSRHRF